MVTVHAHARAKALAKASSGHPVEAWYRPCLKPPKIARAWLRLLRYRLRSYGCVATVDHQGRTMFVADAHRGDRKRFVVRADEKLTAFPMKQARVVWTLAAKMK